ncbi:MAG: PIN domain-containing protein [Bryobacteraceae bacterium]
MKGASSRSPKTSCSNGACCWRKAARPATRFQPDLIIAATAIHHGLTVVTRDRSQYDKARVPVFNPWEQ